MLSINWNSPYHPSIKKKHHKEQIIFDTGFSKIKLISVSQVRNQNPDISTDVNTTKKIALFSTSLPNIL